MESAETPIVVDAVAAVPTAKEIRERAWRALDGKWGMVAGAFACIWVMTVGVSLLSSTVPIAGLVVQHYFNAVFCYGTVALAIALLRGGAQFNHVFSGFGKGWRTLWLLAVSQFFVFLWTLLLVVPGIMKAFSYAMVCFIRVDRPELSALETIAESNRLMDGHRWRYFCMNFSFIGWWLLCIATCGLALFFVAPYVSAAQAAFYEDLLDRDAAARADCACAAA